MKLHKIFKDYLSETAMRKTFHLSREESVPLYLVAYFQEYQYSYGDYWVIEVFSDLSKAKKALIQYKRNKFKTHIWRVGKEIPFTYKKDKIVFNTLTKEE